MSRRLLIVEPDASGRAMMERALSAEAYAIEAVSSAGEARALLDSGSLELAILDELGGKRSVLEEVRWVRREHPSLPIIVTGTLLSQRVLQELIRLSIADALPKPFTPVELREAVARALGRRAEAHAEALEYAAAIEAARRTIAAGATANAKPTLTRAQAASPLDAEVMALWALIAEIEGRDADADRAYRAALTLRQGEEEAPPEPYEGLARLRAYGSARPVSSLRPERASAAIWLITDPALELPIGPPGGDAPHIALMGLGLGADAAGALFLRDSDGPRAFAVMAGALRPESIAGAVARLGAGRLVAGEATLARLDLERIEALRAESASAALR